MYDELVKRLREDVPKVLSNFDFDFVEDWIKVEGLIKEAANAIEELSAICEDQKAQIILMAAEDKPRWIPVTEEPPLKVGDDGYNGYLVYANGYYEVADYTTSKFDNLPYFYVNGEYEPDVTHYMPLPEPPEEE